MGTLCLLSGLLLGACGEAADEDGTAQNAASDGSAGRDAPELSVRLPHPYAGERVHDVPMPTHFVLVSIDTLRADRLGCYGHDRETSPNIDALAGTGLLFTRCWAPSSRTTPSHMTMFTGFLPPVHGQQNYRRSAGGQVEAGELLPRSVPMLAERLSDAGFVTAAFADAGYVTATGGFDRGFGTFDSTSESVRAKVDRSLEWWRQAPDDGRRRFVFFHTYEVHAPYLPPREHDVFTDQGYDGPWRARVEELRASDDYSGVDFARGFLPAGEQVSARDRRYLQDLYDGCIRYTDTEIGRLVRELRADTDESIGFLVTSDHGEEFGEHGKYGHASVHAGVIHVPFVLVIPGMEPRVIDTPISGLDVAPTVMDVLGLDAPVPCEGRSVLREAPSERSHFAYHGEVGLPTSREAWMSGDFKVHRGKKNVLFDIVADPGEVRPLEGRDDVLQRAEHEMSVLADRHAVLFRELRAGQAVEERAPSEDELENLRMLGYLGDG